MKINKKRTFNKNILIISIALLLVIATIFLVSPKISNILNRNIAPKDETNKVIIDYNPATTEQQDAGSQTKSGSSDTPTSPTAIEGSDKKSVSVRITSANQNASTLQIRTAIGAIDSSGTCTLELTREGQPTVTRTAPTQAQASISTCQGFDVPVSDLSTGTWRITIEYSSDKLIGSATLDKVIK